MGNELKYAVTLLIITASLNCYCQLSDDPQYYLEWSDEFGDPHHLSGVTFNLNNTKNSAEQIEWLRPRWDYSTTDNWCQDYADKSTNGNPTIEVSEGILKLRLVERAVPITITDNFYCDGQTPVPNGTSRELKYDSDDMWNRPITPTRVEKFNYGYYELRFKLPTITGNNAEGIQFNWFSYVQDQTVLFNQDGSVTPKIVDWCEIDFIEHSGLQDRFTHNMLFGYDRNTEGEFNGHWPTRYLNEINFRTATQLDPHTSGVTLTEYADFRTSTDPHQTPDNEGFHTMSCEVTPEKVTWYMDGMYLQSTVGQTNLEETLGDLPYMPMTFGIAAREGFDPNLSGGIRDDTITNNTVLPYEVEIDYVRFYRFMDRSSISRIESNATVYLLPDMSDAVYEAVAIGPGSTSGSRVNGSTGPLVLRAEQYIELLPGFEVAVGGELYADVHQPNR